MAHDYADILTISATVHTHIEVWTSEPGERSSISKKWARPDEVATKEWDEVPSPNSSRARLPGLLRRGEEIGSILLRTFGMRNILLVSPQQTFAWQLLTLSNYR